MADKLKPYAGAVFFALLGLGFQVSGYTNIPLAWFIWGAAVFWALVATFKNKKLIRRFPWIIDWFPFVEEDVLSLPKELTGAYLSGHAFRLLDIAVRSQVSDRTIEHCTIVGPAMIYLQDHSTVGECTFDGWPQDIVIEFPNKPRNLVGVIAAKNTTFKKCKFVQIGFVGPEGTLVKFEGGTTNKTVA